MPLPIHYTLKKMGIGGCVRMGMAQRGFDPEKQIDYQCFCMKTWRSRVGVAHKLLIENTQVIDSKKGTEWMK
jgi:hypothetical protein